MVSSSEARDANPEKIEKWEENEQITSVIKSDRNQNYDWVTVDGSGENVSLYRVSRVKSHCGYKSKWNPRQKKDVPDPE